MYKNILIVSLLLISGFAATLYTANLSIDLLQYRSRTLAAKTEILSWEVVKVSSEKYKFKGIFTFKFQGENFAGETVMSSPSFRNPIAAKDALGEQPKSSHVWVNLRNPSRSSLENPFPTKPLVSTGILWGLWVYFVFVGLYVRKTSI